MPYASSPLATTPPQATRSAVAIASHPLHAIALGSLAIYRRFYTTAVAYPAFVLPACAS